ncbi:MAG TPA: MMPL family transporter [Acidimicrobiales bacterium]|nr:MMPL family transporter [Acidimicrobiales bacterium]
MSSALYRFGAWCFRRRWRVIVTWVVVIVALASLALAVKKPVSQNVTIPGTSAQQALDLLNQQFPGAGGTEAQVVFSVSAPDTLTTPKAQQAVEATLAGIKKLPQVEIVTDPYKFGTVSKSGRIAYAVVAYPVPVANVTTAAKNALLDSGGPAEAAGITVNFGGQVVQATTIADTDVIGILIAFLVLLIGFASFLAALLPLAAAIAGVAVTDLALLALTSVLSETSTTTVLAVMVGLAVGIDYSLLVMNRFRQQLIAGMAPAEAAALAGATSGTAVCVAGTTVFVAMVALSIVQIPFLTVMGLAAGGAVVVAVAAALTLLPALLSLTGSRLVTTTRAKERIERRHEPGHETMSQRYVTLLCRQPVLVLVAGVIVLLFVAGPALHIRLGLPDAGSQPTSQTTRRAYDLISDGFGPGANGPLVVVVYAPGGFNATQTQALDSYYQKVKAHPPANVASIGQPITNPNKNLEVINVTPTTGPNDPATGQLINSINQVAAEGQRLYGLQTYVTGQTALNIDISSKLSSVLPLYLAVIVVLCVLLLFVLFRSFLVPIKAVLGYVLSVLAALGAVTFVFQDGHLNGLFGVAAAGPILSFLPILLIGGLFGLAMDYEVFLVSRMREEYGHGDDARAAVVDGYRGSAKVVVSAAIIMISVFGSFIFTPDPITKSLGFCLAVGVLIDAFVVRMTLVPAAMTLFGRAAWWLPDRLEHALPDLDIEGNRVAAATT